MSISIRNFNDGELESMLEVERADRARFALTEENIGALNRYIENRIEPGSFMRAVLENDLKEATACADMYNRRKLFEYVQWLREHAPRACWGSPDKVQKWISRETR